MANPLAANVISLVRTSPAFAFQLGYAVRGMSVLGNGWGLNREDRKIMDSLLQIVKRFEANCSEVGDTEQVYRHLHYIMDNFGKYHRQWNFLLGKCDAPQEKIIIVDQPREALNFIREKIGPRRAQFCDWMSKKWVDADFIAAKQTAAIVEKSIASAKPVVVVPVLDNGYGDW